MAKRKPYSNVAERVLAAVRELNAALVEAYEHPQTRVHMRLPQQPIIPFQFGCEVTRVTKHAIVAEGDEIKAGQLAYKIKAWQLAYKIAEKPGTSKSVNKAKKTRARKAT
jgi:hypothetical protein